MKPRRQLQLAFLHDAYTAEQLHAYLTTRLHRDQRISAAEINAWTLEQRAEVSQWIRDEWASAEAVPLPQLLVRARVEPPVRLPPRHEWDVSDGDEPWDGRGYFDDDGFRRIV